MELQLFSEEGVDSGLVQVSDQVFAKEYNEALVHQIVVAYQANARSANRAQKDRSQVRHSTKKPWKQKGTGRARAGMTSSPLWRGGGRIFPNSPEENFSQKVNKKMFRAGMCCIFSQLVRDGRLSVFKNISVEQPKTKAFKTKLQSLNLESVLILTDSIDANLYLASRNLSNVLVMEPRYVDPTSLIFFKKILLTQAAVTQIEGLLS